MCEVDWFGGWGWGRVCEVDWFGGWGVGEGV